LACRPVQANDRQGISSLDRKEKGLALLREREHRLAVGRDGSGSLLESDSLGADRPLFAPLEVPDIEMNSVEFRAADFVEMILDDSGPMPHAPPARNGTCGPGRPRILKEEP
jgi:hypothetical protein